LDFCQQINLDHDRDEPDISSYNRGFTMYQEITCSHLKPVSSQLLSKTFVGDIFFAGKNMYSNHYFNPQIS